MVLHGSGYIHIKNMFLTLATLLQLQQILCDAQMKTFDISLDSNIVAICEKRKEERKRKEEEKGEEEW